MDLHHLLLTGLPAHYINFPFFRCPLLVRVSNERTCMRGGSRHMVNLLRELRQLGDRCGLFVSTERSRRTFYKDHVMGRRRSTPRSFDSRYVAGVIFLCAVFSMGQAKLYAQTC